MPKFWPSGSTNNTTYCLLHNVAAAILYTWVFNSTAGSLLVVSLFHAAFNTAYVFLPVNPGAGDGWFPLIMIGVEFVAASPSSLSTDLATSHNDLRSKPATEGSSIDPQ